MNHRAGVLVNWVEAIEKAAPVTVLDQGIGASRAMVCRAPGSQQVITSPRQLACDRLERHQTMAFGAAALIPALDRLGKPDRVVGGFNVGQGQIAVARFGVAASLQIVASSPCGVTYQVRSPDGTATPRRRLDEYSVNQGRIKRGDGDKYFFQFAILNPDKAN